MRVFVGSLGLMLLLTACGGAVSSGAEQRASAPAPTPTTARPSPSAVPTGPNVSGCFTRQDGKIFSYGADHLPGVITGAGPTGVVITYERQGNVCTWRPLSDRLVAAGYRVLLYARDSTEYPEDIIVTMGKRMLKEKGVERVFMIGGSVGASATVPAAVRLGDKVAGVVALSGAVDDPAAAGLKVPLLQIGTEDDPYGGATDLNRAHAAATGSPDNQIYVIKGENLHASALFLSLYGTQVLDRIIAFMAAHKG